MAPAPQIRDLNDLTATLNMLSANDTKVIKKAEKMLKVFLKTPSHASYLVLILRNIQSDVAVRHHAALLLKKKVGGFFPKISAQEQTQFKTEVLSLLVHEPVSAVATGIAGIVAVVSKAVFEANGSWDELFALLMQLTSDPNEKLRAINFKLLAELAEKIGLYLKSHTPVLAQIFVQGVGDGNHDVRISALQAFASFIHQLGECQEVMAFSSVLQPLLQLLHHSLTANDDETLIEGLGMLQDLAPLPLPLLNDYLVSLIELCMHILRHATIEESVKAAAAQCLIELIESKPKLFSKQGGVNMTLLTCMEIIAQDKTNAAGSLFALPVVQHDDEDSSSDVSDDDSHQFNLQSLAQSIIDTMSLNIPPKYFVEPALGLCSQGISSPDPHMRKAGCAVLGVITEGCADYIRTHLGQIVPALLNTLRDPAGFVRECACFALGQFAEHCTPDIYYYHAQILPPLIDNLTAPEETVKLTTCYALEYLIEGLQRESLQPFLGGILTNVMVLMQSEKLSAKEMALSVLAATAVCSEKDFLPYVGGVCNLLGAYLFNPEPNLFGIRGKALECLGHIAVGVGGESFRPYFADGMRSALSGCELNDDNLIEHCYVFVANVSKTMGEEFGGAGGGTNYISLVLPRIIESLEESEVVEIGDSDEEEEGEGDEGAAHGGAQGGEGSDGGSSAVSLRLNVEEGFINTKKAALTALGAICEHSGASFAPFIVQVFPKIVDIDNCILNSLHDSIKGEGLSILHYFLESLLKAKGYPVKKNDKSPPPATLPPAPALDEDTRYLTTQIIQELLEALYVDESRNVASRAVEGLQGVVEALGGGGLQLSFTFRDAEKPLLQLVLEVIDMYFNSRAPCQKDIEGGDDGAEEDEAGDSNLLDIVGDLLTSLSAILPASTFVPLFPAFFTPLCSYLKPTRTPSEKSFALGTLAEVFKFISQGGAGEAILPYLPVLLPLVEASLTDLLEGVRRNAAFLVNVLIMGGGRGLAEHYPRFLTLLSPLCVRPAPSQPPSYLLSQEPPRVDVNATFTTAGGENFATIDAGGADVDNSLSALSSMIRVSFSLNFPLPVKDILSAMLNALPLRGDVIEGDNIFGLLCEVNDLQHTVLTEACNVNSFHHWLRISNTNVSALRIDASTSSVPLIVPLYAVLVQSVSGSSNLMKETKDRVRAHLRNVIHNTNNSYSEFTRGYLQLYLSALNDAEVRDAVATL